MSKTFAIIRREFVARVRTKAFLFSTLGLPIFFAAISVAPALLMRGATRTMDLAIIDGTSSGLGASIAGALSQDRTASGPDGIPQYNVRRFDALGRVAIVRDSLVAHTAVDRARDPNSFDGVLVVTDSALITGSMDYLGSNASSLEAIGEMQRSVTRVLIGKRLDSSGIDPKLVLQATRPADINATKVSNGKATGESGAASFAIAYFMGFILCIGVLLYGQQTLTSVIEEKTSRIMEVLASSVRPFQLLLGKILGVGAVGLLQMAIWGGTVSLISSQRDRIAGLFNVSADAMQQMPIPHMPLGLLVIFLCYFVLGFLLFGSLYAAIGSMCNNIKDAQQYVMLVSMVLIFGFLGVFALMKDPTGSLSRTLSLVPFVSQFAMPVRWSLATVPPIELFASLALGILALVCTTWIAGRIYRTGILMYGKKPTLSEVFRWVRVG